MCLHPLFFQPSQSPPLFFSDFVHERLVGEGDPPTDDDGIVAFLKLPPPRTHILRPSSLFFNFSMTESIFWKIPPTFQSDLFRGIENPFITFSQGFCCSFLFAATFPPSGFLNFSDRS